MNYRSEFDDWRDFCRDDPTISEREVRRILMGMCERGNPHAIAYRDSAGEGERLRDTVDEIEENTARFLGAERSSEFADAEADAERTELAAEYPSDWSEIACEIKERREWRCEVCKFQKRGSGLLQVHHIDADKADNSSSNLQVLCCKCHAEKHGHAHTPTWPYGVSDADKRGLLDHHERRRWRAA